MNSTWLITSELANQRYSLVWYILKCIIYHDRSDELSHLRRQRYQKYQRCHPYHLPSETNVSISITRWKAPFPLSRKKLKTELSLWKEHQMFSVDTSPEECKKCSNNRLFFICVWGKLAQGITWLYCDVVVFEKLRFQNVFRSHENEKLAFSNSSGLKSVFVMD